MATTNAWVFEQLEGDKKKITLEGAQAPHGRPRQKPVVSDGVTLRHQTIRYPGSNVPTRHIFGVKYEDWDLVGRWRDANTTNGGAQDLTEQMIEFVEDGSRCRISWGNIISVTGYIESFIPHRESPYDIAWEMKILVDVPNKTKVFTVYPNKVPPIDRALQIVALLDEGYIAVTPHFKKPALPDFLDSLDDLVSSINTFTGSIVNIANDLKNFEEATLGQIDRLRAGIHQLKTAVLTMRDTFFAAKDEALFIYRSSESDIRWTAQAATFDKNTMEALSVMESLDRDAEIAQRGRSSTSYVAKTGDTWERISNLFFDGPQSAAKIRDANGIKYGEKPVPGRTYLIPTSA